jgi:hypothetical protein
MHQGSSRAVAIQRIMNIAVSILFKNCLHRYEAGVSAMIILASIAFHAATAIIIHFDKGILVVWVSAGIEGLSIIACIFIL